ncbi:MAG: DUF3685 domain-containing protein [Jaaginema sp. PMC 1079.18]|nr:DUF3685 domain-containing protein [Jaaginema sp. PMC 1080.18]MEC4851714.1 DUF3685 domain-containing protein [Jaaginema sp. PMC 1079.18]MEC4868404.1 DUF3685 domain-containing protein [Jaaginema sp. PMC 1078.18]
MTVTSPVTASDREIDLYLISDDPVLKLGLQAVFAEIPAMTVKLVLTQPEAPEAIAAQPTGETVEIALLDWPLTVELRQRLQWGDRLYQSRPHLKIVLLSDPLDSPGLAAAQNTPIVGACPKGSSVEQLRTTLTTIAAGNRYWPDEGDRPNLVKRPLTARWLSQNAQTGLYQIDSQLHPINRHLENADLPLLDWLFWTGRRRELKVARWLVARLLPPDIPRENASEQPSQAPQPPLSEFHEVGLAVAPTSLNTSLSVPQSLFAKTQAQLQLNLSNTTNTVLALDILKLPQKRELLYNVLRQTQNVLEELRFLTIPIDELAPRRPAILREIWQNTALDFYTKYYTTTADDDLIVDVVMQDAGNIQINLLDRIPLVEELFAYLLFDTSLIIDTVAYRSASPEAQARAQLLLNNLILQVANAVMQLLLNHFAELEIVKSRLYPPGYQSSRQIARLRNELSWQYRQEVYFEEPQAIFESRYQLLTLTGNAIAPVSIRASRVAELSQLRGIPWLVTILLETRDAIAPRVRAVVSFLGRGVIYLLVQVVGRGIGLIGRGILQGFGNALQETRYSKRR